MTEDPPPLGEVAEPEHTAGRVGAGLDAFAQRRSEVDSQLTVFEIDRPGPQAWKRRRLTELGSTSPSGCGSHRST
jgi:O-methyltransferase involved in polyketide biosynthesis